LLKELNAEIMFMMKLLADLCLIDITAQMVSYGNYLARVNFLKFAATLPPTGLKSLVYAENRVAADGWQGGSKMGKSGLSQSKSIEKRA